MKRILAELICMCTCFFLFISCTGKDDHLRIPLKSEIFEVSSNVSFIDEFKNLPEEMKTNYRSKIYVISGEIDYVTWPKDGNDLIHTAVAIGLDDYNRNTLDGDCISIELDERKMDLKVGDKIKVLAQFDDYTSSQWGFSVSLKHGKIINNLLDTVSPIN